MASLAAKSGYVSGVQADKTLRYYPLMAGDVAGELQTLRLRAFARQRLLSLF
ncbi:MULTISPECIES: hypothetical protein [Tenebrionibacter/Tenebrionicola group]|jgi:hypothetical protein|uniref:Uncharacterized protein n=2 Tax=Tenebrionibacter/Tenebrionicola group TaxID=2969848 RepID=A0A8K0V4V3_9ENTR|nr:MULTISPECIES: hypothetical protein [Tenebrionibacter/Tenebrionicola group]MBK4714222.1 hypothetical protein [Tenebrionibacter intestinalis]MBV4413375.1 hypothetical protein [Tenebrionicola larvae]MBV5094259.1 hypothetical protein [Tenebrionicola larvae]